MKAEIKCPACLAWVSSSDGHCTHCGSVLDRNVRLKQDRISRGVSVGPPERKKTRIDLWLERTEHSENTLVVVLRAIVGVAWAIYMAVLGFIVWLVTLLAG
ncbi:MAG TPA: hypothetical protein PK637_05045 [Flavobacteriales bacterium]|nr:hypothetical protein [Flavobacteriales bacterium]HRE75468.1 hypothetical protein [Flavobacteriales bacterium]HRE96109.1 hypothetical protein [Flavobacteriales bacterium]HRJ36253.1 hypothetical protein [Flavobacteriales bacterium]HRJ37373.1 hypothetical protein [Flavobacteriales bacterium]